MTVYVDNFNCRYGRMIMCHMIADTLDELHMMAETIGVAKRHFQDHPGRQHYDICLSKKQLAIRNGAREISSRELVLILKRQRNDNRHD